MPKLSVYVTDELWQGAKAVSRPGRAKLNNSQLVQWALERLVEEQETRRAAFASVAAPDTARLAAVVEQLRTGAKAEYELGYSAGLDLAEALGFDDLRVVMNAGGLKAEDGLDWISGFAREFDEHPAGEFWRKYGEKFGDDSFQGDPSEPAVPDFYWPNEAFGAGAAQALSDVWETLRNSAWGRPDSQLEDETASSAEEA